MDRKFAITHETLNIQSTQALAMKSLQLKIYIFNGTAIESFNIPRNVWGKLRSGVPFLDFRKSSTRIFVQDCSSAEKETAREAFRNCSLKDSPYAKKILTFNFILLPFFTISLMEGNMIKQLLFQNEQKSQYNYLLRR